MDRMWSSLQTKEHRSAEMKRVPEVWDCEVGAISSHGEFQWAT